MRLLQFIIQSLFILFSYNHPTESVLGRDDCLDPLDSRRASLVLHMWQCRDILLLKLGDGKRRVNALDFQVVVGAEFLLLVKCDFINLHFWLRIGKHYLAPQFWNL